VEKTLFSIAELIKNCEIGNFVYQNINSHSNFEGIGELMCNSFKIKSLLHKLPLNRAAGKDGIFAEHIFYADSSVCNHLGSLFKVCLMHGKIPQECMQTVIVPICKNNNGNTSDSGNYRPVSLATTISKLFEHYILWCISPLLATTDNQFGFKQKHGTDMCIFLFKQTVSFYVSKDTPVFSAFLDASNSDGVSRLGLGLEGLVSVLVSKELGLELFVSRLCIGYFLWSFARRSSSKKKRF